MKARSALMAAAIVIFAPAIATAQSTQMPPAQPPAETPGTANSDTAAADPAANSKAADPAANTKAAETTCDTADKDKGKSGEADTKSQSAKVGKDTGDLPPPRKKTADAACTPQPQE